MLNALTVSDSSEQPVDLVFESLSTSTISNSNDSSTDTDSETEVAYGFFQFLDDVFGSERVTEMGANKGTPIGTKTILTQGSYLVSAQLEE